MRSIIQYLLVLIMWIIMSPSTSAQVEGSTDPSEAIVHLKNGSRIQGVILEWKIDDYIKLATSWGSEITLYQKQIRKVIQNTSNFKKEYDYHFPDKSIYYNLQAQVITGNDGNRAHGVFGFGLSASAGYRFKRLLSVGAGVGYDKFVWDSGEQLIPVFAELSGYFTPSNTSLFYNLKMGYSFANTSDRFLLTEAQGGLMTYPSIGIRFGNQKVKSTIDVGYKFQNAQFTYADAWATGSRSEQTVLYKRLCVRFGLIW